MSGLTRKLDPFSATGKAYSSGSSIQTTAPPRLRLRDLAILLVCVGLVLLSLNVGRTFETKNALFIPIDYTKFENRLFPSDPEKM